MTTIVFPTATCPKCGHTWPLRVEHPKRCPGCSKRLGKGQHEENDAKTTLPSTSA